MTSTEIVKMLREDPKYAWLRDPIHHLEPGNGTDRFKVNAKAIQDITSGCSRVVVLIDKATDADGAREKELAELKDSEAKAKAKAKDIQAKADETVAAAEAQLAEKSKTLDEALAKIEELSGELEKIKSAQEAVVEESKSAVEEADVESELTTTV